MFKTITFRSHVPFLLFLPFFLLDFQISFCSAISSVSSAFEPLQFYLSALGGVIGTSVDAPGIGYIISKGVM